MLFAKERQQANDRAGKSAQSVRSTSRMLASGGDRAVQEVAVKENRGEEGDKEMMTTRRRIDEGEDETKLVRWTAAAAWVPVLTVAIGQFVGGIIWGTMLSERVTQLEKTNQLQDSRIESVDSAGSRQVPLIIRDVQNLGMQIKDNSLKLDNVRIELTRHEQEVATIQGQLSTILRNLRNKQDKEDLTK